MHRPTPTPTPYSDTVTVKGVKVVTPAGIGVEGGEFSRDPKDLQVASDAPIRADQQFVTFCRQLPSYSNDKVGFYARRDQMSDIVLNATHVATVVANSTGQATPAPLLMLPTASTAAATDAGVNPSNSVANPPATVAAATTTVPSVTGKGDAVAKLKSAVSQLNKASRKKAPKHHKASSQSSHRSATTASRTEQS